MNDIDLIKERVLIYDVVREYVHLVPSGTAFKGKCPFHNEKTPSFYVQPERGTYKCFGCGESGDIFSFITKFEGIDFAQALHLLAGRAGIVLQKRSKNSRNEPGDIKATLYEIMEVATEYFVFKLSLSTEGEEYLAKRGVTSEMKEKFRIGYAPDQWQGLYTYLVQKGFSEVDIISAGLARKKDTRVYDLFRGRIMFPVCDSTGRVIAFSGRIFPRIDDVPKYVNSPETPLFKKSQTLYGLHHAKSAIRTKGFTICVEGQMDVILSHSIGMTQTIALLGTAFSETDIQKTSEGEEVVNALGLVKRLASRIILVFDGDTAGVKATFKNAYIAKKMGLQPLVLTPPEGLDPADFILKYGKDSWRELLKQSEGFIVYTCLYIRTHAKTSHTLSSLVETHLMPYFSLLDSIEKEKESKTVSQLLDISEKVLREKLVAVPLKNTYVEKKESSIKNTFPEKKFSQNPLRRIIALLCIFDNENVTVETEIQSRIDTICEISGFRYQDITQAQKDILLKNNQDLFGQTAESFQKMLRDCLVLAEIYIQKDIIQKKKNTDIFYTS